jgi:hypothetical protein
MIAIVFLCVQVGERNTPINLFSVLPAVEHRSQIIRVRCVSWFHRVCFISEHAHRLRSEGMQDREKERHNEREHVM